MSNTLQDRIEHDLILELHEWRGLSNLIFRDFHGQQPGEDLNFNKLEKRENRSYRALLAKVESLVESESQRREEALLAKIKPYFLRPGMYFGPNVNKADFDRVWGQINE